MLALRPVTSIAAVAVGIAALPRARRLLLSGQSPDSNLPYSFRGQLSVIAVRPRFLAPTARVVLTISPSLMNLARTSVVLDRTRWGLRPPPLLLAIGPRRVSASRLRRSPDGMGHS